MTNAIYAVLCHIHKLRKLPFQGTRGICSILLPWGIPGRKDIKRRSVGYLSPRSYLTVLNFKTPSVVGTVLKESALFV